MVIQHLHPVLPLAPFPTDMQEARVKYGLVELDTAFHKHPQQLQRILAMAVRRKSEAMR